MKRRLIRICVFLLLGATVNVAVAWGCADHGVEIGRTYMSSPAPLTDANGLIIISYTGGYLQSAGLPLRSMERHLGDGESLMRHPIWPGFAINTVFYAMVVWLLLAAPFVVRRLRGGRRIRRGLCPKCAYDLRGSSGQTCPECGTAVAKHKAETHKGIKF